jgi:hypothetical protein
MLTPLLLIVLVHLASADYNDPKTRTTFFPVAAAAYADDPMPCMRNAFGDKAEVIESIFKSTFNFFSWLGLISFSVILLINALRIWQLHTNKRLF